jgi:hypothetical protein
VSPAPRAPDLKERRRPPPRAPSYESELPQFEQNREPGVFSV